MRTKALLLGAALTAAGLATSLAQSNVYSLNVVGYVNVTLPGTNDPTALGFSILGNPLDLVNVAGDNIIDHVIPPQSVMPGTTVWTWNPFLASYTRAILKKPGQPPHPGYTTNYWDTPTLDLTPGNGFWLLNQTNTPVTVTFVGEVQQSSATVLSNGVAGAAGGVYNLMSSRVPQLGQLDTVLGYPANTNGGVPPFFFGTHVVTWGNNSAITNSSGYNIYNFQGPTAAAPSNHWSGAPQGVFPVLDVGQGFWVSEKVANKWVRTFNVQ